VISKKKDMKPDEKERLKRISDDAGSYKAE
jgi:hypothetical protein